MARKDQVDPVSLYRQLVYDNHQCQDTESVGKQDRLLLINMKADVREILFLPNATSCGGIGGHVSTIGSDVCRSP